MQVEAALQGPRSAAPPALLRGPARHRNATAPAPWARSEPYRRASGAAERASSDHSDALRVCAADGTDVDAEILPPVLRVVAGAAGPGAAVRSAAFWQSPALPRVLEACSVAALHTFGDCVGAGARCPSLRAARRDDAVAPRGLDAFDLDREFRADCRAVARAIERLAAQTARVAADTRVAARMCGATALSIATWRAALLQQRRTTTRDDSFGLLKTRGRRDAP